MDQVCTGDLMIALCRHWYILLFCVCGSVTPFVLFNCSHVLAAAVALVQGCCMVDGGCRSAACYICRYFDFCIPFSTFLYNLWTLTHK